MKRQRPTQTLICYSFGSTSINRWLSPSNSSREITVTVSNKQDLVFFGFNILSCRSIVSQTDRGELQSEKRQQYPSLCIFITAAAAYLASLPYLSQTPSIRQSCGPKPTAELAKCSQSISQQLHCQHVCLTARLFSVWFVGLFVCLSAGLWKNSGLFFMKLVEKV